MGDCLFSDVPDMTLPRGVLSSKADSSSMSASQIRGAPRATRDRKPAWQPTFWLHINMGVSWAPQRTWCPPSRLRTIAPLRKTMTLTSWQGQSALQLASSRLRSQILRPSHSFPSGLLPPALLSALRGRAVHQHETHKETLNSAVHFL